MDNRAVFLENKVGSTKNAECGERLLTIYHIQRVLSALRNPVLSAKLGVSPAEKKDNAGWKPGAAFDMEGKREKSSSRMWAV